MKRFTLLLFALFGALSLSFSQTGNGVLILAEPTFEFDQTTVDSTASVTLQLKNAVGAAQTIYFGGLDAPFSLADNTPIEIPSQDTVELVLNFTPSAVGSYSDTLEVIGNIFGSAQLIVTGQGIQVQLEWSTFEVQFDTTAIGATSYADVTVTNVGDGVAYLSPQADETGLFSVEFVDDWVNPGMPEPCATIDGINFYPFTLTINPSVYGFNGFGNFNAQLRPVNYYDQIEGQDDNTTVFINLTIDSWTGGQWYVEYPYLGYDEYVPVGTPFEVCLPVTSEGEEHFYWYVHSDDCNFAGTYLSLTDAYGFLSWESPNWDGISLNYCDWGSDYQGYSDLEVTIPSAPAFTPGELQEDETQIARFSFSPLDAGEAEGALSIATNSPVLPQADFNCVGTGVSEVSGEICDLTWTLSNSPYTLVGDVVVPEGCTLNIDPGVEVIGNGYNFEVFGAFFANGEEGNEVQIEVGELLSHTSAENMVLTRSTITETNEFVFPNVDFRVLLDNNQDSSISLAEYLDSENASTYFLLYENENVASHIGKYSEDFSDNNGQGWTHGGDVGNWNDNGEYYVYWGSGGYNSYPMYYIYSPTFSFNPGERPETISYRQWMDWYDDCNDYSYTHLSINGGSWIEIDYFDCDYNATSSTTIAHQLSSYLNGYEEVESLQVRWQTRQRYYGWTKIDDFALTTNFYLGEDVPVTEAAAAAASLSTGGIQLSECTYNGDFQSVGDSLDVVLNNSTILANTNRDKDSHGLGLYANHVNLITQNSSIAGHSLDGIHIESTTIDWTDENSLISNNVEDGIDVNGDMVWGSSNSEVLSNGADGILVSGDLDLDATELDVNGNGTDGLDVGANSNLNIYGARIQDNGARAIGAQTGSVINLDYVLMDDNDDRGIELAANGSLNLGNCRLRGNGAEGIHSGSPVTVNHCGIAFSGGTGLVLTGNNFHTLNNSILWGNNSSNYTQIDIGGGVISTSYSTVQGRSSYGTTGSGQYYWGEGVIEADPLFADDDLHLEIFSPCVDGGQPWHQDAHMPYGLGGVRADMGMYGGPDNAYWGGDALPDGASVLSGVSDSPQDQGGVVGLVFDASFYDNTDLVNNVTSYAFWRHYDPTGGSIGSLDEGNWELIGEMPAQSFNGYAYQAPTLGNTNSFGTFNSCYTVVAHTDDEDTYWYSNVMCGESVDNLAPDAPEVNGLVVEGVGAQISWEAPLEPDYAYTEITNPDGYLAELGTDTVVVDPGIALGEEVTYSVRHFDVNGNASPAVELTLLAQPGLDVIPLAAGWNLISTDRMPADASAQAVFSGLASGNLQYVTGFDGGVTFYDPDGFQFLNSLDAIEGGKGYWVKVLEADTLEVAGAVLGAGFESTLTSGWNLIGYAPAAPTSPASFFNELISTGELEYVTGFDGGSQFFDPNGLPFLNSLEALKNGFGYWVKVVADYNPNGMLPSGEGKSTPTFMLINGTTNLPALAGSTMEVINEAGEPISTAEVIAGGYIMTTPLFGDDPSTSGFEGLELGETLRFRVNGMLADEAIEFTAGMDLKKLSLTFPEAAQHLSVFPNPASDRLTISGTSLANTKVSIQILDPTGRVIMAHDLVSLVDDWSYEVPAVSELAAGLYSVRVTEADGSASTVTWVRE